MTTKKNRIKTPTKRIKKLLRKRWVKRTLMGASLTLSPKMKCRQWAQEPVAPVAFPAGFPGWCGWCCAVVMLRVSVRVRIFFLLVLFDPCSPLGGPCILVVKHRSCCRKQDDSSTELTAGGCVALISTLGGSVKFRGWGLGRFRSRSSCLAVVQPGGVYWLRFRDLEWACFCSWAPSQPCLRVDPITALHGGFKESVRSLTKVSWPLGLC